MLGIIGGTSLLYCTLPALEKRTVATPYGPAEVMAGESASCCADQFGKPPQRIHYWALMAALALRGVDRNRQFRLTSVS